MEIDEINKRSSVFFSEQREVTGFLSLTPANSSHLHKRLNKILENRPLFT